MNKDIYQKFLQSIDKIFESIGLESEKDQIKENLIQALFVDFANRLVNFQNNQNLLEKIVLTEVKNFEDFEKVVEDSKGEFEGLGFNIEKNLNESANIVLDNFKTKLL